MTNCEAFETLEHAIAYLEAQGRDTTLLVEAWHAIGPLGQVPSWAERKA